MNQAGLDLIKEFEGCKLEAYQDQRGIWTIGYGSTTDVEPGMVITEAEAELRLEADLAEAARRLGERVSVALTENQCAALISFVFNIGCSAFAGSTLCRLVNAGEPEELIAAEFPKWCHNHDGTVNAGLLRRREAERALFLTA